MSSSKYSIFKGALQQKRLKSTALDSYQYTNNTKVLCIWARERCRPS